MKEYIADYMNISPACVVVRLPGEPTEEYQETIANAGKSEYKNKLQDIEMSDAPKVNAEDFHSTKANTQLILEDKQPMVFGDNNNKGIILDGSNRILHNFKAFSNNFNRIQI